MNNRFSQIYVWRLLMKWKFHLAIIVLLAVILSAIFSAPFFITPKFKSFAIVYPANIMSYSDESRTEQMLQIMESRQIADSVIAKYNLAAHYEIDQGEEYFKTKLMKRWLDNVDIKKTDYQGVKIVVLDRDPQMAADIVKSIIYYYNEKISSLHKEKFLEVVRMYERAMTRERRYVDSLQNRYSSLSERYGLLDYQYQSREVARGVLGTVDGTSSINRKAVDTISVNLEEKGAEMILLQNMIEFEAEKYTKLKEDYDQAVMDYDRNFSYTNVVTPPFVSDKKAYPIRWLIVVISAIAAFVLSFTVIIIFEKDII